jgi:hypothetical protein
MFRASSVATAAAARLSSGSFDVFLSHNWGRDSEGRDNHARVRLLRDRLTAAGLRVWFDETAFEGKDINREMAEGIEKSTVSGL